MDATATWNHRRNFDKLVTVVGRLIKDYQAGWAPQPKAGRPPTQKRNDLIIEIAKAFHVHSGWTTAVEYRPHLQLFLVRVLVACGIYPPASLLRLVPQPLRVPRRR